MVSQMNKLFVLLKITFKSLFLSIGLVILGYFLLLIILTETGLI